MLALSCLRYWWHRPPVRDSQNLETLHSTVKSTSMTSVFEPVHSPQYDVMQYWCKITSTALDPMQKSAAEIEKAIASGKDMILVEPSIAGHVYAHYLSHGWLLQENIICYSSIGLFTSYFFPKTWFIYVPCSLLALLHSWIFFKVYKQDRLSQYQAYDDDRHPVSNLITAWVIGHRPDHFQYVLRKERLIVWEMISQLTMYTSVLSTLFGLKRIEEGVAGNQLISAPLQSFPMVPLSDLLSLPADYASGYFQPQELLRVVPQRTYLPADIPEVTGWFDLPVFNLRLKPMKYDLAMIICAMGGYFAFRFYEHFFGYREEIDGIDTELHIGDNLAAAGAKDPLGMIAATTKSEAVLGERQVSTQSRIYQNLKSQEESMIAQISGQVPYGWKPPGYASNQYGVFT